MNPPPRGFLFREQRERERERKKEERERKKEREKERERKKEREKERERERERERKRNKEREIIWRCMSDQKKKRRNANNPITSISIFLAVTTFNSPNIICKPFSALFPARPR